MNIETVFKITASVAGQNAVKGLVKDVRNISSAADVAKRGAVALKGALLGLAAGFSVMKVVQGLGATAHRIDDVADAADRLGVSAASFSRLAYAAKLTQVPVGVLESSLRKMLVQLSSVKEGSDFEGALTAIGLKAKDLKGLGADEILARVADGLNGVSDASARARIQTEIFGKGSKVLYDLLKEGSAAMREYGNESDRTGNTITEKAAKNAGEYEKALARLDGSYQGLKNNFADTGALEALTGLVNTLSEAFGGLAKIIKDAGDAWDDAFGDDVKLTGMSDKFNTDKGAIKSRLEKSIESTSQRKRMAELQGASPAELARFDEQIAKRREQVKRLDTEAVAKANAVPKDYSQFFKGKGGSGAGGKTEAEKAADEQKKLNEELEQSAIQYNQTYDAQEAYRMELEKINQAYATGKMTNEAYNNAIRATKESYIEARNSGDLLYQGIESIGEAAINGQIKSFEDLKNVAVATFAKILAEYVRMQFQMAALDAGGSGIGGFFKSLFSMGGSAAIQASTGMPASVNSAVYANGGIHTSSGSVPLKKYATGGIANSPQLAMFGEGRLPEAYVPLPDGRRIPVAMKGTSGSVNNVSVVVNMNNGQSNVKADGQRGEEFGRAIKAAVIEVIHSEKRPGGSLNNLTR